jgi:hypothetical protein
MNASALRLQFQAVLYVYVVSMCSELYLAHGIYVKHMQIFLSLGQTFLS